MDPTTILALAGAVYDTAKAGLVGLLKSKLNLTDDDLTFLDEVEDAVIQGQVASALKQEMARIAHDPDRSAKTQAARDRIEELKKTGGTS